MTPEELNRTIEFLIQHSAELSAHQQEFAIRQQEISVRQEQDHELLIRSFVELRQAGERFESQAQKDRRMLAELLLIQSNRLDRLDKWSEESEKRHEASQKRGEEFISEALRLLHGILDRLTQNPNSKN